MKSGKQRRAEISAKRKKRAAKRQSYPKLAEPAAYRMIAVNEALLAPNNSYGVPDFVSRGYYVDLPFRCVDCGSEEIWTGTQQKWWYEVAKGFAYSAAIRCRSCRRKERARRDEARRVHLEGLAKRGSEMK
jgi:hypothetical protein